MEILDAPISDSEFDLENISYASFGERLVARIIDGFILVIPSMFIPIVPSWLYCALMESGKDQATVGKKAMGLIVTDLQGNRIDFGRATGRFFGNFVDILTLGVGYLVMLFNPKNQCLHDMMAGTLVLRAKPTDKAQKQFARTWEIRHAQNDYTIIQVDERGLHYFHRSPMGDVRKDYSLQEVAQGTVDLNMEFGWEKSEDIKSYTRELLNYLRQKGRPV